jgi:hypothetical protein
MCVYVHMSVCRHSHFRDNLLVTGFHKQCLCADSCVHLRVRNVCKSTLLRSSLQSQAMLTTIETPLNPPANKQKRRRAPCDDEIDVFTFVQPWADLILDGVRGSIAVCICKVRSHHALACFSPVCGDVRVEMHRLRALVWRTCMFTFSCMHMCGHMYVCLCVHMYMCMHVCTCVRICMYVCVGTCVGTYVCVYVGMYIFMSVQKCVCMYICMCACMGVCACACVYACMQMYFRAYICTYTHGVRMRVRAGVCKCVHFEYVDVRLFACVGGCDPNAHPHTCICKTVRPRHWS